MPEALKDLRRRVRTVDSTKQITRAMEMVSASKLRRAQLVLEAGRPYSIRLERLLSRLAGSATVAGHPLFEEREGAKRTMVIITADRGLCGGFNNNLIKLVENHLKANAEMDWELVCIGKRGHDYFKRRQWPIVEVHKDLGGKPDLDLSNRICDSLVTRFTSGQTDGVYLYYQSFISMAKYVPTLVKFVGLDAESLRGDESDAEETGPELEYLLEPTPEQVFQALLPRYLTSKIYITMAEVFTAEHSARMVAMSNATKNCEELSDDLTLKLNKARQAQITNELLDIVGGAEAI